MQTTTVLPPGGAVPAQNVVFVPQYVTSQPAPRIWANYASKSSTALGATQMMIGLLCVLCNAVAISAHSPTALIGHGIWGGLFVSVPLVQSSRPLAVEPCTNTCNRCTVPISTLLNLGNSHQRCRQGITQHV